MKLTLILSLFLFSPTKANFFKSFDNNKKDKKIAKNIKLYLEQIKEGKHLKTPLKRVSLNRSSFKPLKPLLKLSRKVLLQKKSFKACQSVLKLKQKRPTPFAIEWHESLKKFCQSFLLDLIVKKRTFRRYKKTFEHFLPDYLKDKSFSNFLKKISKKRRLRKKIHSLIAREVIKKNLPMRADILNYLKKRRDVSRHVKKKGLHNLKKHSLLLAKFEKLTTARLNRPLQYFTYPKNQIFTFLKTNRKYFSDAKAAKFIFKLAKRYRRKNKLEKAQKLFYLLERLAVGELKDEALFQILWPSLVKEKFFETISLAKKFDMLKSIDKLSPRTQFFLAYALKQNLSSDLAETYFNKLIRKHPLSYYAILARKNLNKMDSPDFDSNSLDKIMGSIKLSHLKSKDRQTLRRMLLWLELGEISYFKLERELFLENLQDWKKANKSALVLNLIRHFNEKGDFLQSFELTFWALGRNLLKVGRATLKMLFPFPYLEKIKNLEKTIDPLIFLSLIRQESAFDPLATSGAGAMGLMQLMPNTAREVAQKKMKVSSLYIPGINLKLGINHFSKLLGKYNGNLIFSLAAYNAGEHRLSQWKKKLFSNKNPLMIVESIPFNETRKYVKLIYRNIFFYKYLINDPELSLSLNESFKVSMVSVP